MEIDDACFDWWAACVDFLPKCFAQFPHSFLQLSLLTSPNSLSIRSLTAFGVAVTSYPLIPPQMGSRFPTAPYTSNAQSPQKSNPSHHSRESDRWPNLGKTKV